MGITKKTLAVAGLVGVLVIVLGTVWFFWPAKQENIVLEMEVKGNSNTVETYQAKEISLIHIENMKVVHHKVNIINWMLFAVILLLLAIYGAHYWMIRVPRNIERRFKEDRKTEKLDEVLKAMMDLGYLRKKQMTNKRVKGKTTRASKKQKEEEFEEDFQEIK